MTIQDRDRRLLWGKSGFLCAICRVPLAADATALDRDAIIGEECHIVAQSPNGPRGEYREGVEIDGYDNLILLCRNHHREIDEQPRTFTVETLRRFKEAHESFVRLTLRPVSTDGPPERDLRAEAVSDPFSGSSVVLDSFPSAVFLPSGLDDDQLLHWRISDAFPGRGGLVVVDDPRAALDRLDVVLRHPIEVLGHNKDGSVFAHHPFYWFRGSRNMHVSRYARLDDERCLINEEQLRVSRVAAYRTSHEPRQFIYIESKAEPPTGLYKYDEGEMEPNSPGGFYRDEAYGIWRDRFVPYADYEDRATVIDGKPVHLSGAEPRIRFLTPYNLILCCRHHVVNDIKRDDDFRTLLDGILRGTSTIEDLVSLVESLPTPPRLDPWY